MASEPHRRRLTAMFSFRYPAVIILSGLTAGIIIGRQLSPGLPLLSVIVLAGVAVLLWVHLRRAPHYFAIPLFVFVFAAGWFGAAAIYHTFPADDIGRLAGTGEKCRIFGEIVKWPVIKKYKTVITCRVDSILRREMMESASGQILVTVPQETTRFAWGDGISFGGVIKIPRRNAYPEQFDYARYLADKGIRGTASVHDPALIRTETSSENFFGKSISRLRGMMIRIFNNYLSPEPAALASGFLIGETHNIPDATYQAFRRTGTMHLLAVSGSNVALVLIVVLFLVRLVPANRYVRTGFLLAVIVVFSNLSYNQPSVVRAAIMAALALGAGLFYRRVAFNNIIPAAAAIILFFDPTQLFDIGFELSFAVTWGLALFLPPLNSLCESKKLNRPLRYLLLLVASSLVATLISAPITAYYFGQVSLVSVLSNLIIVPLVSAAVVGIMVLLLLAPVLPPAAAVVGSMLDSLLRIITRLVDWFSLPDSASALIPAFHGWYVFLFLGGITLLFLACGERRYRRLLLFYILIAGSLHFIFDIIPGEREESSLDIIHDPGSQTIVVNDGGGVVLFRQAAIKEADDFSGRVIPHLLKRNTEFPRYFVFFEPQYLTEERLEKVSAGILPGSLLPAAPVTEMAPSVYRYGRGEELQPADSGGRISVGADWAVVQSGGGHRIVFVKPGDLSGIDDSIVGDSGAIFIIPVRGERALKAVQGRGIAGRLILLPEKGLAGRGKEVVGESVEDDMDHMDAEFVEVGEYVRLPLKR
jgi:competence protein ComEC